MSGDEHQKKIYKNLYKQDQYLVDLPDKKITDGNYFKNKKILSIGAGTGRDIWYLAKDNQITAIDSSEEIIHVLNPKGIKTKIMNLEKELPFPSESFDLVIAKDILEHITYPLEICKEIKRVLKPTGYAVINVPNHFCFPMRLRYLFGKNLIWKTFGINHENLFEEWNYMHIRYFTWKGFKKLLEKSELHISKTFFDIFTLNHYTDPEIVKQYFKDQNSKTVIVRVLNMFNLIFPRFIRRKIANISPNLLSGSFYVWVKPI
jgi:ubiquinone/menaquinone biosynthesis C-methylase UbiE